MKNIIITSTDATYGDFLINHWLKSLKENVNLTNIDILVLDYGLTNIQIKKLNKEPVILKKCVRNGHVVTIRFRDIYNFLKNNKYDQVLSIDSGDVIFQSDINHLFNENKNTFRAFCEKKAFLNFNNVFLKGYFDSKNIKNMKPILKNRFPINGGVILSSANKFKQLAKEIFTLVKNKTTYGPDQVAMNYVLYRDGFKELSEEYNTILCSSHNFYIKKGIFYLSDGKKVQIVHNAGGYSYFRGVNNFGYGPNYNTERKILNFIMRNLSFLKRKIFKYV